MYFSILKKDLKRKKTMNVILILFIILAAMFVSGSVNSIVTVSTALDSYFEKAEVPDFFAVTLGDDRNSVEKTLDNTDCVSSYDSEEAFFLAPNSLKCGDKEIKGIQNTVMLQSADDMQMNYFDKNDDTVTEVARGEIYVSAKVLSSCDLNEGDVVNVKIGDNSYDLKIKGGIKDALLGSTLMGNVRFILNDADYSKIVSDAENASSYTGNLYYITTSDEQKTESELSKTDCNIIFMGPRSLIRMSYVMDMVVSVILLVASLCLIIISFVVLRFTISFTLSEEYREIGVMKAIGISNFKIRSLYMIKYLGMAVAGTAAGFVLSIPFGKMLLNLVSDSVVMNSGSNIAVNILCSLAVVAVILLFCYGCTGKAKKFSPVDAVRNGQTGERFRRKSLIHLGKSRMNSSSFMAVNDILSSPKRYAVIAVIFAVCLLMIQVLGTTANTLRDGRLVSLFGMTESDAYISIPDRQMTYMADGGEKVLAADLDEMEKKFRDNGMPAECVFELQYKLTVSYENNVCKAVSMQGVGTTADEYTYTRGVPPENADEIAVTEMTAEQLGAAIGDTVKIRIGSEDREFIITAVFQSMNNLGEGIRFHEDAEIPFSLLIGTCSYQINFTDNPDEEETEKRIEKLEDLFPDANNIQTSGEVVADTTGVADTLSLVKNLIAVIAAIIIILVSVLMERSMIAKEQGEIAVLKAIGFKDSSIISWHTKRFIVTACISAVLAIALALPVTSLVINPVFVMMGASEGVEYTINIPEVFIAYPLALIAVMALSVMFTAVYTKRITAAQTADIE